MRDPPNGWPCSLGGPGDSHADRWGERLEACLGLHAELSRPGWARLRWDARLYSYSDCSMAADPHCGGPSLHPLHGSEERSLGLKHCVLKSEMGLEVQSCGGPYSEVVFVDDEEVRGELGNGRNVRRYPRSPKDNHLRSVGEVLEGPF